MLTVNIPTCGVKSCPFQKSNDDTSTCGPGCGKNKKLLIPPGAICKKCQCRFKSPLTFRTCICPGFECPRIENDVIWPCPCPLPSDEKDNCPIPEDLKKIALDRSKLTENTSGFKVAVEKKKPFEGDKYFEEALKFFVEHPEFLPGSQTSSYKPLITQDEYHSDCCCEDSKLLYELSTCPGDEPFVSDRLERLRKKAEKSPKKEKKGRFFNSKKGKKDKSNKDKTKKDDTEKEAIDDQLADFDQECSASSLVSPAAEPKPAEEPHASLLKDAYTFTIPAKGSASPGLSGICCYEVVTELSKETVPYLLLPPPTDSSTSSDSNTYLLYTP